MSCLITTRASIKKTTRKNNKTSKNKSFTVKIQCINLKAASNIVKMQSDKILKTKIYFANYTADGKFT